MVFRTENDFETALVHLLTDSYGWNKDVLYRPTEQDLIDNWAEVLFRINNDIDRLNGVPLNEGEMQQLLDQINRLQSPLLKNELINGGAVQIKRENKLDTLHYGREISLKLFDKREIAGGDSNYQIVRQPHLPVNNRAKANKRGDLMLLINGLPLFHIELKQSGVGVDKAVNQIERYLHNRVYDRGFYSLVQLFVAMTPDDMRYFARPTQNVIDRDYVFPWADFNNEQITQWQEIAERFLSIPMAHLMFGYYTVADKGDNVLKVLRSYQVYAAQEVLAKVRKTDWSGKNPLGGYIWHTTGSGKTLTSFKTAELIASYNLADKVIFLMDRVELGTQTLREFKGFSQIDDSVGGTRSSRDLYRQLKQEVLGGEVIVTSIQKMDTITKKDYTDEEIEYINDKRLVFIVDEAHRSTFGEMLARIKLTFDRALFFGFTGTPIHDENSVKGNTTATIFGPELHRYSLADGIRDKNVLGFDLTQQSTILYRELRKENALKKAGVVTMDEIYEDPEKEAIYHFYIDPKEYPRIGYTDPETGEKIKGLEDEVVTNKHFETEEHRLKVVEDIEQNWVNLSRGGRYSALLTVPSRKEAIQYYRLFKKNGFKFNVTVLVNPGLSEDKDTIFVEDGIAEYLTDYNNLFEKNFSFPDYDLYQKDVSSRLARKGAYHGLTDQREILHLVIVVNQLLTGYDSKWINTLYVDKRMEYANIIQSFSRTNRLNAGKDKPFGTIRYYRFIYEMEQNIKKAVESYSGGRPVALFVDKLPENIITLNDVFNMITSLFEVDGIENFSRLPKGLEAQRKFASLVDKFSTTLEAASIQGFSWDQKFYGEGGEIELLVTYSDYQTWLVRYGEIARDASSGDGSPGSDDIAINYNLIEAGTGRIDYEYMNANFTKLIRSYEIKNVEEQERIRKDLHRTFAKLTDVQQHYAYMILDDLRTGDLQGDKELSFMDYVTLYQQNSENKQIQLLVSVTNLDQPQLEQLMSSVSDVNKLNEFGQFDSLKKSCDRELFGKWLMTVLNTEISPHKVSMCLSKLLKTFILRNDLEVEAFVVDCFK